MFSVHQGGKNTENNIFALVYTEKHDGLTKIHKGRHIVVGLKYFDHMLKSGILYEYGHISTAINTIALVIVLAVVECTVKGCLNAVGR